MSIGPSFRVVTHFLKSDLPLRLLTCHPSVLSEYRLVALVSTNFPSEMMVTSGRMTLNSGPWKPGFSSVVRRDQDVRASDSFHEFPILEKFAPGRRFVVSWHEEFHTRVAHYRNHAVVVDIFSRRMFGHKEIQRNAAEVGGRAWPCHRGRWLVIVAVDVDIFLDQPAGFRRSLLIVPPYIIMGQMVRSHEHFGFERPEV